ncbi:hypothetical protein [Thermoanaerobacter kivui]|nr:hypothetical protein [Thermoanaerobacter kivui]
MRSKENTKNLVLWMAHHFKGLDLQYEEAIKPKWEGIYHPLRNIHDEQGYIEEILQQGKIVVGVPT